ncbi:MAG: N-6 DNA methylase [Paludibacter sp.]|nr:N-6 DNA methylase [Paludibacter sp.]
MGLFQKSVISKYLKTQNKENLASKWAIYRTYFLNPKVQEEIRSLKEEQYQGEFLEELFVKILGYTKPASSCETKFNLTTEYKNIKDSKKVDGAIIVEDKVKAVIELKGTNTTDLGKIEVQAFGYKNNQPDCIYVITSNFEKLRFYIDNAIEHIDFNLFTLTEEEFQLLYLCLGFENLSQNIAKKIKDDSLSEEDLITKKLYKDYSLFKRELHQNLVELNPDYDPLVLFKKSQKLLDRFLFLFFGEDRHLLPPNSVRLILTQWNQLRELDEYTPLYVRFKKYFGYLNTGHKGKQHDVFAYNGGLFKPDEVLDTLKIDDNLLYKHTLKLSEYDFASEVDVNILGHIFENSLNELDEIKAQFEGQEIDKTKTKRKKDGIFYTPKYITKYIVENTIGKLCEEKKTELRIVEEEYFTDKKRTKTTKLPLLEKLEIYRKWLLQLTICDPACGSGAFLNQALDFLITEHRYVDELQAKLFGDAMVLSDIENSILENNLFGVDLNEESVEIAKLSLWLRTAQPNRKLNDLSNNIKCGNSLIDDPKVAVDKAFDWQKEFPQVFGAKKDIGVELVDQLPIEPDYLSLLEADAKEAAEKANKAIALSKEAIALSEKAAALSLKAYEYAQKLKSVSEPQELYGINKGGFDVVIGNPPYGAELSQEHKVYLEAYYETFEYQVNTYVLFYERGLKILNYQGILGYITPATFTYQHYFKKIRDFLHKYKLVAISKFYYEVFEDADIGDSVIYIVEKTNNDNGNVIIQLCSTKEDSMEFPLVKKYSEIINLSDGIYSLSKSCFNIHKTYKDCRKLAEISNIIVGIKPYQTGKGEPKQTNENVISKDFTATTKKNETYIQCVIGKDFHRYKYLQEPSMYLSYGKWLAEPRKGAPFFDDEKILIRQTADSLICQLDSNKRINLNNVYNIGQIEKSFELKYILSLLNSKLMNLIYQSISQEKGRLFAEVKKINLAKLPIKVISSEQQKPFIAKVDILIWSNKELQQISQKFQRTFQRKFELEDLPKRLQDWYLLSYADFIRELTKKKVKLSLSEEAEWEDYFLQESKTTIPKGLNIFFSNSLN